MGYNSMWAPYVPVAERKAKAAKHAKALQKKGQACTPVTIEGRTIAKTFWGRAWCENLEAYSDYSNRLPRGRTYVRNGSVIDLQILRGEIKAMVMGSSLYHIAISIEPMVKAKWHSLVAACSGKIDSLIELLQGKFSKAVMEIITRSDEGLFPKPKEIKMRCSCPDGAYMCKHIAAVLYGVGAVLDTKPESLFALRHVEHLDLVASASSGKSLTQKIKNETILEDSLLSTLFDIEMADSPVASSAPAKKQKVAKAAPKATKKKIVNKKTAAKAKKKTAAKVTKKR